MAGFVVFCIVAISIMGASAALDRKGLRTTNEQASSRFDSAHKQGDYNFGYDEAHAGGSTGRREQRLGGVVRGSYNLADADGRRRWVKYVADEAGFRATIHTNEPGVDTSRSPADVLLIPEEGADRIHAPLPTPPHVYRWPVITDQNWPLARTTVYADEASEIRGTPNAFSYSFGTSHSDGALAAPPANVPEEDADW